MQPVGATIERFIPNGHGVYEDLGKQQGFPMPEEPATPPKPANPSAIYKVIWAMVAQWPAGSVLTGHEIVSSGHDLTKLVAMRAVEETTAPVTAKVVDPAHRIHQPFNVDESAQNLLKFRITELERESATLKANLEAAEQSRRAAVQGLNGLRRGALPHA